MYDFLRENQTQILLAMGAICSTTALFVLLSASLPKKRRIAVFLMEISAAILMFSDRYAYIFRGNTSLSAYYMVRISNYLVFAMTLLVAFSFNLFLEDMCISEVGLEKPPKRLRGNDILFAAGELLLIVSQFTGLYYTFDEYNRYTRAPLFFICYIFPLFILMIQLSIIIKYFKRFSVGLRLAMLLMTVLPLSASILQ